MREADKLFKTTMAHALLAFLTVHSKRPTSISKRLLKKQRNLGVEKSPVRPGMFFCLGI